MNIARRLSKLATALPAPQPAKATREEKQLTTYLLVRAVLQTDRPAELRDLLSARIEEVERCICRQASRIITDQLARHIEYVENVWVASGRQLPFVPPVIGSWWDDWFAPDLTVKRLAIRRHPSVVALIGDTTASPWGRNS
jgi:hypothetical protein